MEFPFNRQKAQEARRLMTPAADFFCVRSGSSWSQFRAQSLKGKTRASNAWLGSALWLGLALLASLISIRIAVSVALAEIVVGAIAGNLIGLHITDWVNFLAGFGAILLTFLAGTEIDPCIVRKHFWSSMTIGLMGFFAPYLDVLAYAFWVLHWPLPQAQIAGISLSTTSVAVVYAVMIVVLVLLALYAPRIIRGLGHRVSEPRRNSRHSYSFRWGAWPALPAAKPCFPPIWSEWRWRRLSLPNVGSPSACAQSHSRF
jgi:hypothetical protein